MEIPVVPVILMLLLSFMGLSVGLCFAGSFKDKGGKE